MNLFNRFNIIITILFLVISIDHTTKFIAKNYLIYNELNSYLFGVLHLVYTSNYGAFLSLGNTLSPEVRFWLLQILVGIVLFGMFVYAIYFKKYVFTRISGLSLIIGGGSSNLLDRIMNDGAVVDFLSIGIGTVRTGIFNVSDICILLGMFLILVYEVKSESSKLRVADRK
ncbi:MAG: signal peptidase II [Gammaproteobacteria bacterium]|nr:signal peptidase II [Gammaproteobacteria bacterium]